MNNTETSFSNPEIIPQIRQSKKRFRIRLIRLS